MRPLLKLRANARVSEVGGTVTYILKTHVDVGISEDASLQTIINELADQHENLILAIEQDRAFSEVDPHDELRDTAVRDMYYYAKGCSRLPVPAVSAAQST